MEKASILQGFFQFCFPSERELKSLRAGIKIPQSGNIIINMDITKNSYKNIFLYF